MIEMIKYYREMRARELVQVIVITLALLTYMLLEVIGSIAWCILKVTWYAICKMISPDKKKNKVSKKLGDLE